MQSAIAFIINFYCSGHIFTSLFYCCVPFPAGFMKFSNHYLHRYDTEYLPLMSDRHFSNGEAQKAVPMSSENKLEKNMTELDDLMSVYRWRISTETSETFLESISTSLQFWLQAWEMVGLPHIRKLLALESELCNQKYIFVKYPIEMQKTLGNLFEYFVNLCLVCSVLEISGCNCHKENTVLCCLFRQWEAVKGALNL